VKTLVQHGADVSLKTAKGQTPLQLAVSNNQDDVAAFLRSAKWYLRELCGRVYVHKVDVVLLADILE